MDPLENENTGAEGTVPLPEPDPAKANEGTEAPPVPTPEVKEPEPEHQPAAQTPETPQSEPSAPTEPKSEEVKPPSVEERLAAVEADNVRLREQLDERKEPEAKPAEPQVSPEEFARRQEAFKQVERENAILAYADRIRTEAGFKDEQIAERGVDGVNDLLTDAKIIANNRRERAWHYEQDQQRAQQDQVQAAKQEWTATRAEMDARAKSLGLSQAVVKKDKGLQALLALGYPTPETKQAIEDRLFRIAHTQGVPPTSQSIVTAEQLAARKQTKTSVASASSDPAVATLGQQMVDGVVAAEETIDPLDNT
jgi:hypothetical protein